LEYSEHKRGAKLLTVVDLFAGCGGLSLGLERAGFETVFVNELHPDAMKTFVMNRPHSPIQNSKYQVLDILKLTRKKAELTSLAAHLNKEYRGIDLVVGGPPCQGFSGIGHRRTFEVTKEDIPTNYLYREMAKVVTEIAPKAFVFENVRGLLTSRWTPDGEKGEIWKDVLKTFSKITVKVNGKTLSYQIGFELVYAKDYGVPQNRPRIVMIGIREDIPVTTNSKLVGNGLLPQPTGGAPDPYDLLSDLVDPKWVPGGSTLVYPKEARSSFQKLLRDDPTTGKIFAKGAPVSDHEYSNHSELVMKKFQYMIDHDGNIPPSMKTKKFAQRLLPEKWGQGGPNITATSLPDDYVHFSQPRVLTVREWARLQTFPDWYEFNGKRTTGGRRRAGDLEVGDWTRDLPKYTQIGNAVPVLLGEAIGNHIKKIINTK
jgi:DNA (cytosine-5)-methyltransferase 1